MTPRLFVRDDAAADIAEAAAWYEARREGLGSEFTRAVRRFPYIVFFIPESAQTVVIAVLHGRRDPQAWQSRGK